jgi:hypothetical protein
MKKLSIALALAACAAAAPASAQYFAQPTECWNPSAGHFEGVRPGEVQNDLDFRRCRPMAGYRNDGYRNNGYRGDNYYRGGYRGDAYRYSGEIVQECWNPGARHFEGVRPGEVQTDLDFSRCRPLAQGYVPPTAYSPPRYAIQRECWNPRAGHFEGVREGERQDDLDYSHCRRVR